VGAMQRKQFRAKTAKNDLQPTGILKRNVYFETEGGVVFSVAFRSSPFIGFAQDWERTCDF
jgi:hypothetical protein